MYHGNFGLTILALMKLALMKMNQLLPIYVIALPSSTDRRAAMNTRLGALDLDFTFIDAVVGRDLTDKDLNTATSPTRQHHLPMPLSKGAIGGGLSHLKTWQHIAKGDAPMALILEDDAIPSPDMIDICLRVQKLGDKIDIVNLHFRGGRPLVDVAQLSPTHRLTSCRYNSIGAESYIITKDAAQKLVDAYLPMMFEVDLFINRWWDHGLHILTINPPVVCEDTSPTTIGYPSALPTWPNDRLRHRLARRINRIWSSMLKRRLYPSMVATAKMRLMGVDPNDVGNNHEFPNLTQMTDHG